MKTINIIILLGLALHLEGQEIYEPSFNLMEKSICFPSISKKKFHHGLGVRLTYLPKDWLESASSYPMLSYKASYFVTKNISVQSDVKSIWIANELAFGPALNIKISERLYGGISHQMAFGLGHLNDYGYNTFLTTHSQRSQIKLGYLFSDFTISSFAGIEYFNYLSFNAGDVNISSKRNTMNGLQFGINVEQKIFHNNFCVLGFQYAMQRFHILGWPAFNSTRDLYYIPEFLFMIKF